MVIYGPNIDSLEQIKSEDIHMNILKYLDLTKYETLKKNYKFKHIACRKDILEIEYIIKEIKNVT